MNQGNKFIVGLILLILVVGTSSKMVSTGSFGIIRHDKEIDKYAELGNRVEFNSVGRYSESIESEDFAAGVLISSNWVLTAAHFVQESSYWKFGARFYKTKRIVYHPELEPGSGENQWNGNDLALIELEEPVIDVEPAIRYRGNQELGKEIVKIGYGFLGNGKIGLDSVRRQIRLGGKNTIDAIGGTYENRDFTKNVMVCDFDSPETIEFNRFGSAIPLDLEIGGSKGDSGGGTFMKDSDGRMVLVGIVSGALNREIKYGAVMALARVSTSNNWIDSTISK